MEVYLSDNFVKYCNEKGISRQFTNPYCPEQNGVAERLNRTIIEGARSILCHAKLPLKFWAEAVSTVVYLRNRSPTAALKGRTPYEYWFGEKPDVSNLRVFGCICFVHIPDNQRKKLDPKSYKAVFVGYPEGTKGFKVWNVESEKFARSRNVLFHENKFHNFNNNPTIKDATETIFSFDIDDNDNNALKDLAEPVGLVVDPDHEKPVGVVEPDHDKHVGELIDHGVNDASPNRDEPVAEISDQNESESIPTEVQPTQPRYHNNSNRYRNPYRNSYRNSK